MTIDIVYIMAVYFLFILLFGGRRTGFHSAIIFASSFLNILFQMPESTNLAEYIYNRNLSILWDGATALILTMFLIFDKVAWKQALLLAFAVLCHTMIICHLTIHSSWYSIFFYNYYDELIILVGLSQMGVSYNGFTTALSNLQGIVSRFFLYSNRCTKSLLAREERETKT